MNSIGFAFLLCLLSIIVVKCGYRRSYRRDYRPRLSYDYNDGDNDDDEYPSHFPRQYSRHYHRDYPHRSPRIRTGYQIRGPSQRKLPKIIPVCFEPPVLRGLDVTYEHPRNSNCQATYKEGNVLCFNRAEPEPRQRPGTNEVRNPLYEGICANARALTEAECYTPPVYPNGDVSIRYPHPTNTDCYVEYETGTINCKGDLQDPSFKDDDYIDKLLRLYQKLCSFYCEDLLTVRYYCVSNNPLSVAQTVRDNEDCYIPEESALIDKYYLHPRNFLSDRCIVTYNGGDIYCWGRHELDLPEPRRMSALTSNFNDSQSIDVLNPLYHKICRHAVALTTMPCYSPPSPPSPGIKHYQHPTLKNCYVSYDKGQVFCDGVLKPSNVMENELLYQDLCATYCPDLLPYMCTSTRPISCKVCGYIP